MVRTSQNVQNPNVWTSVKWIVRTSKIWTKLFGFQTFSKAEWFCWQTKVDCPKSELVRISVLHCSVHWVSEIQTSMDFRHSITVRFPNSSDFRHFCEMSEIWTQSSVFRTHNTVECRNPNIRISAKADCFRIRTWSSSDFGHLVLSFFVWTKKLLS